VNAQSKLIRKDTSGGHAPACLIVGPESCELRIIRKISKAEVQYAARYCAILSSDKLVEALAFPLISQQDATLIADELDRRLLGHRLHRNDSGDSTQAPCPG
jgi:hypothetical protein